METSSGTSVEHLYGLGVQPDMYSVSGFRGAVGRLDTAATNHGMCSATALSSTKVLTAAHCICDWWTGKWIAANAIEFSLPQGATFSAAVSSYSVHPGAFCLPFAFTKGEAPLVGPPDLAVLTLTTPIPVAVLQDYPRLHLGPMKADWESSKLDDPGFQVGWGGTQKYDSAVGAGTRQYGPSSPWPALDPCDQPQSPVNLEGWCNDYYQWEDYIAPDKVSVHAEGDSGGPLYMTNSATGGLSLVGVSSGWRSCDPAVEDWGATSCYYKQVWAPTGNVGGLGNHTFLINALGGDADGDGFPDDIDTCPALANPDQFDADGDGIGDECDNCAPPDCAGAGLPPGFTCYNPQQQDGDGDGIGDTCDRCPELGISYQGDKDGDGVGDWCDECQLVPNGYRTCSNDAECALHHAGTCIADATVLPIVLGRCSREDDDDDDELPNACDLCPGFVNASNDNSNDLAEEREQATNPAIATLADECDPVPVVRVPPQESVTITPQTLADLDTTDGVGWDEILFIPQNRWLGRQTQGEPPGTGLKERLGYRQCDCFDATGIALELRDCVGDNTQCAFNAPLGDPQWTIPTLTLTNNAPLLDAGGFSPELTFYRGVSDPFTLIWRWRDDLANANITGQGTCTADVLSCEAHIALFTTTQGPTASSRDASANLRDVFQLADGPGFSMVLPLPYAPPPKCQGVACLQWFNVKLGLVSPELGQFGSVFKGPIVMEKAGPVVGALVQPADAYDISGSVSVGVKALMDAPDVMWLTPVESASRVRRLPGRGGVQAVGFPRDFTATSTVDVVYGGPTGLTGGRRLTDVLAMASLPAPGLRPRPRSDVRALLSGLEEAVYMVGGRSADGRAAQAIWRYDLGDRSWRIVAEHASVVPSSQMLAVTYDQKNGQLYVLDLDDEVHPNAKIRRARLTSYDVRRGTAVTLTTWPYVGLFEQLWLAATDDGALLLVAGRQHVTNVWKLRPKAGGVKYEGIHVVPRPLFGQPAMAENDPIIAVAGKKAGTLEYRTLAPDVFAGPQPCTSL